MANQNADLEEVVEVVVEDNGKGKGQRQGLSPDELEQLQGMKAELLRLSSSLGAQWVARSKAEGKVRELEAKDGPLRMAGVGGARGPNHRSGILPCILALI